MSSLGFSNTVIGVFNALPAAGVLLVGLPVAAMADRIGYRLFLLAGSLLALSGGLVLSVAASPLLAVLAAGSFALAITVLQMLAAPMLAQLSRPNDRVTLFAVNESLAWIATVAGNLVGGLAPELAARWTHHASTSAASLRAAFLPMTALLLAAGPVVLRLSRSAELRPVAVVRVRELLRVDLRRFARILAPLLLLGIGAGILLNFVQLYLAQRFDLGPGPIGAILSAIAVLTAATSLLAPALSRRLGLTRAIGLAQLCGFPLVLGLAYAMSLPLAVALLAVRQVILNLQSPLFTAFGMDYVAAAERARYTIAQEVTFGIGLGGIGPLLFSLLQARGGYQLAFTVSACFYLLGGSTFLGLFGGTRLAAEG
jgi:MFS family permease